VDRPANAPNAQPSFPTGVTATRFHLGREQTIRIQSSNGGLANVTQVLLSEGDVNIGWITPVKVDALGTPGHTDNLIVIKSTPTRKKADASSAAAKRPQEETITPGTDGQLTITLVLPSGTQDLTPVDTAYAGG
jgi:hypothetical protein